MFPIKLKLAFGKEFSKLLKKINYACRDKKVKIKINLVAFESR